MSQLDENMEGIAIEKGQLRLNFLFIVAVALFTLERCCNFNCDK